jgi:hypothetical protein
LADGLAKLKVDLKGAQTAVSMDERKADVMDRLTGVS